MRCSCSLDGFRGRDVGMLTVGPLRIGSVAGALTTDEVVQIGQLVPDGGNAPWLLLGYPTMGIVSYVDVFLRPAVVGHKVQRGRKLTVTANLDARGSRTSLGRSTRISLMPLSYRRAVASLRSSMRRTLPGRLSSTGNSMTGRLSAWLPSFDRVQ